MGSKQNELQGGHHMIRTVLVFCATCFWLQTSTASLNETSLTNSFPSIARADRAESILAEMTLSEKISVLSGDGAFSTPGIQRLGVPSLKMMDGPLGVRFGGYTAFPAGVAMASSFDPDLIEQVGAAIARDAKADGRNMLLGPCVEIARMPLSGRIFEAFGEDPYLSAQLTKSYVSGVQSENVIATTKHFAVNDQELMRMSVDSKVGERALREIHLLPFEAAVDAGTGSIMSAYNQLNGHYASENPWLLNKVLKQDWGFQGFVVSDWGATKSTLPSALAGLDIEMPWGTYFGTPLQQAVLSGLISEQVVNEKVLRILHTMEQVGLLDSNKSTLAQHNPEQKVQQDLALKAAQDGLVLLQNKDNLLPLRPNLQKLAFIGSAAMVARTGGGGSSFVHTDRKVSPMAGWQQRQSEIGGHLQATWTAGEVFAPDLTTVPESYLSHRSGSGSAAGLMAEYYENTDLSGKPAAVTIEKQISFSWDWGRPAGVSTNSYSARFSGSLTVPRSGNYELVFSYDDGLRVWVDDQLVHDDWKSHDGIQAVQFARIPLTLKSSVAHHLKIEYLQIDTLATLQMALREPDNKGILEDPLAVAVQLAKTSEVAVVFVGLGPKIESEGFDRASLSLPFGEDELITKVAAANPNTVVVVFSGTPILMPWKDKVKSILMAWYPGQEAGLAVSDALLGKVNPSGKLPMTFPESWAQNPTASTYPGDGITADYAEGLYVGYRYYEKKNLQPLFPFGFGLSYTQFQLSELKVKVLQSQSIDPLMEVTVMVKNAGLRAGAEVAQVYIAPENSKVDRPVQELKAFAKVALNPGESKAVTFRLSQRSFAYWNEALSQWTADPGSYEIRVGTSSQDLPLKETVTLQ